MLRPGRSRRCLPLLALALLWLPGRAAAQGAVHLDLLGAGSGTDRPAYPRLVPVPSSPVYYDPIGASNLFFYDGRYWVYQGDAWYLSDWFAGPWELVARDAVPLHLLRVPIWFYRQQPGAFRTWRPDGPPRWGALWGKAWEARNQGWDAWSRTPAPLPAPLPAYQRDYAGDRYPSVERQRALHLEHYRYQPSDAAVRRALLPQDRPGLEASVAPLAAPARRPQARP
jgi:hypothetical protein